MIERVIGTLDGHSAAINVGIGFKPTYVWVQNLEDIESTVWWSLLKRDTAQTAAYGLNIQDMGTAVTAKTTSAGISVYDGGDLITSANQGEAYKVLNQTPNYRSSTGYNTVTSWTLDTPANKTGHFDVAINSTYVLVGSQVVIDGRNYWITVSDGTGTSADSITLNAAAPSGRVDFIGSIFSFTAAPLGTVMPAGFTLGADSETNVDGETVLFIAEH